MYFLLEMGDGNFLHLVICLCEEVLRRLTSGRNWRKVKAAYAHAYIHTNHFSTLLSIAVNDGINPMLILPWFYENELLNLHRKFEKTRIQSPEDRGDPRTRDPRICANATSPNSQLCHACRCHAHQRHYL